MSIQPAEEDAPAMTVANTFADFLNIVGIIASHDAWQMYCQSIPEPERKPSMLKELSAFIDSRRLLDLPEITGPKATVRRALDAAPELNRLISEWDGMGEPSPTMVAWAIDNVASFQLTTRS